MNLKIHYHAYFRYTAVSNIFHKKAGIVFFY